MAASALNFTLAGAILPAIKYRDASGATQTLNFRMPPRDVAPMTPDAVGADDVATDGTMWSVNYYTEGFIQFKVTVLEGQDLTNWLNFLTSPVFGQVLTFYPNQSYGTPAALVRIMTTARRSSSVAPAVDPKPKSVGPGRYEIELVLRFEQASPILPPAAPALSAVTSGTQAARTEDVVITYANETGETTASAQSAIALALDQVASVASPPASDTATGYNVYACVQGGTLSLQNSLPIAIGTAWQEPAAGLSTGGAQPPSANTTGMQTVYSKLRGLS